ncbi:MAG TPA: hypothetical protein VFY84_04840 [Jiangellales bacterium]|nr:hypothetical protein [Jiangellales bacterium]
MSRDVLDLIDPPPHPTPEDTMTDETRFVLIKPGDVLLIGGVRPTSGEDAEDATRKFKDLAGVRAVVLFADEIAIDRLDSLQLLDLVAKAEARDDT